MRTNKYISSNQARDLPATSSTAGDGASGAGKRWFALFFSWLELKFAAILLALLAGICGLEAQDTNGPAQTNDATVSEDLAGTDSSQTAEITREEETAGTNTLAETNQIVSPGPDGRARRQLRRSQNRPRDNARSSNSARPSSTDTNAPSGLDYTAFRLVVDRNIFDPNRAPRSVRPVTQSKTVDAFTLVGTMSYEKGIFAFFDGTSSDYKKVVKPEDTIAGYKVAAITSDSVSLMRNTNLLELKVGTQMRRREDGSWDRSAGSETYAASPANPASNSSTEPASSDAESDIIKKMMQRREKE